MVRFVRDPRAYLEAMRQVAGADEAAAVVADVHRMERPEERKAVLRALRVRAVLGPEDRVAIEFNRG